MNVKNYQFEVAPFYMLESDDVCVETIGWKKVWSGDNLKSITTNFPITYYDLPIYTKLTIDNGTNIFTYY